MPPLLSVSLNESPTAVAVTLIDVFSLIASSTSSTVRAKLRSITALAPLRSVMRILPRATPLPAVQLVERNALVDESAGAERQRACADRLSRLAKLWLSSCCADAV